MDAVRDGRLETARTLVLAARAGLEGAEPARDRVLDAAIEADVEVHERHLLETAPVATEQRVVAEQIEGAAEAPLARSVRRDDDMERFGHAAQHFFEEFALQVAPSPRKLVDRRD